MEYLVVNVGIPRLLFGIVTALLNDIINYTLSIQFLNILIKTLNFMTANFSVL